MTAKTGKAQLLKGQEYLGPTLFPIHSGPFGRKRHFAKNDFFFWFATLHRYLSCKGGILDIIITNTNSEEKFTNTCYLVTEGKKKETFYLDSNACCLFYYYFCRFILFFVLNLRELVRARAC